jgi:DNA-binding LytR/AlgR family response regulator
MNGTILRTLIVDDDPVSRNLLEQFVAKAPFLRLLDKIGDPSEAINYLSDNAVELLILDVNMPEMTGLQLIESLSSRPLVIMVSADKDYALEAFDLDVVDFLLKPLNFARFYKAAIRAQEMFQTRLEQPTIEALFIRHNSRFQRLNLSEITWIEAVGDYVNIVAGERRFTVHTTMKLLESRLPAAQFQRVHRSFIVRLDAILEIEDNTLVVKDKLVPIGKSYREGLFNRLNMI